MTDVAVVTMVLGGGGGGAQNKSECDIMHHPIIIPEGGTTIRGR